jgi:predicted lipoprotein with Yx(FWY)xxD motif
LTHDTRWNVQHRLVVVEGLAAALLFAAHAAAAPAGNSATVETYVAAPMPPEFKVEISELEGPVFADSRGRTLYMWPSKKLRNGYSGEMKGKSACYDEVRTQTAGLMSPYPPGLLLPELDKRPSCTKLWPPVLASDDAKPVGKWTIVTRADGSKQWAYDEQPLYTSILDRAPGDALGGTTRKDDQEAPAIRVPVGPPPRVPPGFAVKTTSTGRLLTTEKNYSVYTYDKDSSGKSMCDSICAQTWNPLIAPQTAQSQGEWSTIERSAGVRQWTFREKPLYTYVLDTNQWSLEGSDVPGWRNVYTQRVPPPPQDFTIQDTIMGQVLADRRGMTIYTYTCGDDSVDQLSCDHPDDTQVYRLAMCGGGDSERCLQNWRYVRAEPGSKKHNRAWTVMQIDPKTGHRAASGQADGLEVWAYRDRPVYTYAGDRQPGDVNGDGTGEWRGWRDGLKAFWLRDNYYYGAL